MQQLTLRSGLIFVVVASLLPIGTLSVVQTLAVLDYNRELIGNRLATSALATAGRERDPLIIAERVLRTLSHIDEVKSAGPNCRTALASGLVDNPGIANFVRVDASGRVVCSVLPFEPGMQFAQQSWWKRGIAVRHFTISSVVMGPISKIPVLIGVLPLFKANGASDGAVLVGIKTAWLNKSLAEEKLSQHAVVALVGSDGEMIMIDRPAKLPRLDVTAATGKVIEGTTTDGQAWLYAVAPLYQGELYIVYAEPRKALMATVVKQARVSLILPLLALFLTSLAMWVGTNRLVIRWLDRLRDVAEQFGRGEYQNDPSGFDRAPREIGQFSTDLHAMGKAIETRDSDLRSALDAKTALTSEIHHRVKNNLQIVSSLLNLQAGKVTDAAAREALNQTCARIGALAQIHRLLYEDTNYSDAIDLSLLLSNLCTQLRSLHRHQANIRLVCNAESCVLPVSSVMPLSLFAVEAVTNGFRHAFPNGRSGTVTLHSSHSEKQGLLRITDDGIGFDADHEFRSMGHQLMAAFAQQLDGTFTFENGQTGGSVVTLTYPIVAVS